MKPEQVKKQSAVLTDADRHTLEFCARYAAVCGLELTEADWTQLQKGRRAALHDNGLVEFEEGILPKLMEIFCDSPYLAPDSAVDTFCQLQEVFYGMRADAGSWASDEELLEWMKQIFDGPAQGSVDYLAALRPAELMRLAKAQADGAEDDPLF